jgi:hypothetical protein
MSGERHPDRREEERPTQPGKRPYQKPSFAREQVFETMALACGKINPAGGCMAVRKTS